MPEGIFKSQPGTVPLVAIAVVNFNGWKDTLDCLESVRGLTYPNYVCVLVDNNSADDSVERIRGWAAEKQHEGLSLLEYDSLTSAEGGAKERERLLDTAPSRDRMVLITSTENLGPTGGANIAIRYALQRSRQADYVFLLDNDALIDASCLTALVELERKAGTGVAGGITLDKETGKLQYAERTTPLRFFFSPLVRAALPLPEDPDAHWETANANGSAMLIRRDVLEKVFAARQYYLCEPHFRMGWEFEFCHFSSRLGYRVVATRKAFVRHKGELNYRQTYNASRYYYSTRNKILMADAFLSFPWRPLYHIYSLPLRAGRMLKVALSGRPDVARAIWEGTADGYRGATGRWKRQLT